jgi:hypothetical protein
MGIGEGSALWVLLFIIGQVGFFFYFFTHEAGLLVWTVFCLAWIGWSLATGLPALIFKRQTYVLPDLRELAENLAYLSPPLPKVETPAVTSAAVRAGARDDRRGDPPFDDSQLLPDVAAELGRLRKTEDEMKGVS